jgi:uncharacterized lipoprotein YbaY
MEVRVRVVSGGEGKPEPGTPVRVELRDVSLADAPSKVVASADTVVKEKTDGVIADTTIEVDDATWQRVADLTLWARVASSGAGRTAPGDWITMQSVPLPSTGAQVDIAVRRVG